MDTTQVFQFSNAYLGGDTLTGSVTLDTTLGTVTGEDFTIGGFVFTGLANVPITSNPVYTAAFFSTQGAYLDLLLPLPTLIGYSGGFLCVAGYRANCVPAGQVNSDGTVFNDGPSEYAYSGSLTPVQNATVTPEPSSLALLGTGVLGVIGVVRRRLR